MEQANQGRCWHNKDYATEEVTGVPPWDVTSVSQTHGHEAPSVLQLQQTCFEAQVALPLSLHNTQKSLRGQSPCVPPLIQLGSKTEADLTG
jgi:hypothetical protein